MNLNFVGKKILLVGVVLLSLAWLGQLALADGDGEIIDKFPEVNG
jgi:hypothetical protein